MFLCVWPCFLMAFVSPAARKTCCMRLKMGYPTIWRSSLSYVLLTWRQTREQMHIEMHTSRILLGYGECPVIPIPMAAISLYPVLGDTNPFNFSPKTNPVLGFFPRIQAESGSAASFWILEKLPKKRLGDRKRCISHYLVYYLVLFLLGSLGNVGNYSRQDYRVFARYLPIWPAHFADVCIL